jgi:hypothetical protein
MPWKSVKLFQPQTLQAQTLNEWKEVAGQLNNGSVSRKSANLIVYQNRLYTGTQSGELYQWNDVDAWDEVAPKSTNPSAAHLIRGLCVFDKGDGIERIYAIAINPIENTSSLFEWNGLDIWNLILNFSNELFGAIVVYKNDLYIATSVGSTNTGGKLYKWNKGSTLNMVAAKLGTESWIESLYVYQNKLYAGTYPNGKLYQWDDVDAWVKVADAIIDIPDISSNGLFSIPTLLIDNGRLYACVANRSGFLEEYYVRWNDLDAWEVIASEFKHETNAVVKYGLDIFFAGSDGTLNRLQGSSTVKVADKLNEQAISSLCVYKSKLYSATHLGGRLFEWQTYNVNRRKQAQVKVWNSATGAWVRRQAKILSY